MSKHPIVHVEIPAKDPSAAGKFYQDLFGWEIQDVQDVNYTMFTSQETLGGGFPILDPAM
jgi:predicted enzyme related to lactoylglutathione lyase